MDEVIDSKLFAVFFVGILVGYVIAGGSVFRQDTENSSSSSINLSENDNGGESSSKLPDECSDVKEVKKDMCIANSAIDNNDSDMCELASSEEVKDFCKGFILKEEKRCEDVKDEFLRERCMKSVKGELEQVTYENVPKECEGVDEDDMDMCIAKSAINNSNMSLCEEPGSEGVRNYCKGMISGEEKYCEDVSDEFLEDKCISETEG